MGLLGRVTMSEFERKTHTVMLINVHSDKHDTTLKRFSTFNKTAGFVKEKTKASLRSSHTRIGTSCCAVLLCVRLKGTFCQQVYQRDYKWFLFLALS